MQLLGGVAGTLVEGLLMPGVHVGHNKHVVPSGCFAGHDVGAVRLILIEFVFTLLFLLARLRVVARFMCADTPSYPQGSWCCLQCMSQ